MFWFVLAIIKAWAKYLWTGRRPIGYKGRHINFGRHRHGTPGLVWAPMMNDNVRGNLNYIRTGQ